MLFEATKRVNQLFSFEQQQLQQEEYNRNSNNNNDRKMAIKIRQKFVSAWKLLFVYD